MPDMPEPKSKSRIRFTGMDYGLLVRMDWEAPFPQLLVEIEEHIQKSPAFFVDAKVFLGVDTRPVLQHETEQLGVVLARYGLTLQGVVSTASRVEGLSRPQPMPEVVEPVAPPDEEPRAAAPVLEGKGALVVEHRTVRSGEVVASEGHLVIMGDVNPGAEVIAENNIIVWGSLKGTAYAGVPNHEDAVIAALHLAPIQLRIAGYIARSPDVRPVTAATPELARIDQNEIVVESWEQGRVSLKRG
ncbi:MAG: septum site-determining protein MinC [Candidatus Tectomicrobia bacterium]|nr:septum site-determining protein MinC [Candidatus Tectomicrobia bacterium]